MKLEVARIEGTDLRLKVCVYPEVCGNPRYEKHEEATYGLGASNGVVPTRTEQRSQANEAIKGFFNILNLKYAPVPSPETLVNEGSTAGLPALTAPQIPPPPPPPPPPPEFAVDLFGSPTIKERKTEDGKTYEVAVARFKMFRNGKQILVFEVEGATAEQFAANKATKIEEMRAKVLSDEAVLAKAQAIVGEEI